MVHFDKFILENGLKVIVNQDKTTPIVTINLLYNVGAKHEDPHRTGFAHLFEHLMFEGSKHIPAYDTPLQMVGGDNNAFTNNDITNYYLTLPKENMETGFWLESDRMLELSLTKEKIKIQKNVVIEEFNQRYLNQPYGDAFLMLRPMAYKKHPYRWPTIGKEPSHIQQASFEEVQRFFYKHYAPNNAIITVAGNVTTDEIKELTEKWFAEIPRRELAHKNIPKEPRQDQPRKKEVFRDVPQDTIYKAYHMCERNHEDFYATDLISDLLANGNSSRLHQKLVKEKNVFNTIDAYITGDIDEGLLMVSGSIADNMTMRNAEEELQNELNKLKTHLPAEKELEKVKNKVESVKIYTRTSSLHKAINLSFYELIEDAQKINTEIEEYRNVTPEKIKEVSQKVLDENNCSTLYYHSKNK